MRLPERLKFQIFAVALGTLLAVTLILTLYWERATELVDAALSQQVEVSPSWEITVRSQPEQTPEEIGER